MSFAVVPESTGRDPSSAPAAVKSDSGTPWRRRLVGLLAGTAWVAVSILLQLSRSRRTPVWDDVWAEDARYFYSNARTHPWHSTLFEPIAGYLQVVPRGWSIVAAQFPVVDGAFLIAFTAALSASVLSVYVFVATRRVLPQTWQRYAAAGLIALHPAASWEVNAALNNVHWFFMMAAFWACLSEAGNRWRTAADVGVVVLSALSDPLTALFLPIVLVRAWRSRGSARWVASALLVSLVLQYVLAIHNGPLQHSAPQYKALPEVFAFRLAGSLLVGETWNRDLYLAHGAVWVLVAAIVVVAVLAVGLWRLRGRNQPLLALAVGYAVAFLAVPLVLRGGAEGYLVKPVRSLGSRYVIVPLYLGYVAWIVLAGGLASRIRSVSSSAPERKGPRRGAPKGVARVALPVLVGLLLVGQLAGNFATLGARTSSASWRKAVASAEIACASGQVGKRVPSALPRIAQPFLKSPDVVWLPVAPWSMNWPARLPCNQL